MEKSNLKNIFFLYLNFLFILFPIKTYSSTNVGGVISQNTIWTKTNSPYIVTSTVEVYGDATDPATLTIEPGVEVRFNWRKGLKIGSGANKGILRAIGTDTEKIIFTANTDNFTKGFWKNINIDDSAMDYDTTTGEGTILENCIIEYGGNTNVVIESIYIFNSSPSINKCEIKNSGAIGINVDGYFSNPVITNNIIKDNSSYPIRINPNSVSGLGSDNVFNNNNPNMIAILAANPRIGFLIIKEEVTFNDVGIPYYIEGDIIVFARNDYKIILNIKPNVEMRFANPFSLSFHGSSNYLPELKAIGTKEKPIKFTSTQAIQKPGDWAGILFDYSNVNSNSVSEMTYCIIEYGGGRTIGGENFYGNIYLTGNDGINLNIDNCIIRKSFQNGIFINYRTSVKISNCEIKENNTFGVYNYSGESTCELINNKITGNGSYGVSIGPNDVGKLTGNYISENFKPGTFIVGGTITDSVIWTKQYHPYIIANNVSVNGANFPLLTLEPGVELRFLLNKGLTITNGAMAAIGTLEEQIKFTSDKTIPISGDWEGITFNGFGNSEMRYCTVEYGKTANINASKHNL